MKPTPTFRISSPRHIQNQNTHAHRRELHLKHAPRLLLSLSRRCTLTLTEREVRRHRNDDFRLVPRVRDVEEIVGSGCQLSERADGGGIDVEGEGDGGGDGVVSCVYELKER